MKSLPLLQERSDFLSLLKTHDNIYNLGLILAMTKYLLTIILLQPCLRKSSSIRYEPKKFTLTIIFDNVLYNKQI